MTGGLEPGSRLGRYEVEQLIGQGGMGRIYKVRDPRSKLPYAVKVLHPELSRARDFIRRFKAEAKIARRLSHMNVVHVFAMKRRQKTLYYVMEFVEGASLAQRLEGGRRFTLDEALGIIRETATGLIYIHSKRFVHRDIKPGNILIRRDDHLKIADFGLAQRAGGVQRTRSGHVMGTAKYMAPELIEGTWAGSRTDIYALGCMAYELIAGRPPFIADHAEVYMDMHQYIVPKPLTECVEGIDRTLSLFVGKMLEKSMSRRVPSAQMVHAWLDFYLTNGYFADLPSALA